MTTLTVYIDFKSPGSYLAIAPTLQLAARRNLALRWLPLQTRQERIPEPAPQESRGDTHRRVRALARRAVHLKYAAIRELPMVFLPDPGQTDLALATLLLLADDPVPFMEMAFTAYWQRGEDLDDAAVIGRLLRDIDAGVTVEAASAARERLADITASAEADGVPDAPAYVFDDQVFVGREHLPVIEDLLYPGHKTS